MNLQLSKKENHRAVAPIIATLILVAIAVVGGVMIFVFAQDFFGGESMTGPGTIDQVSMAGYDFRDVGAADSIKNHKGILMVGTLAGTSGKLAQGDQASIFIRNSGTSDVSITSLQIADGAPLLFDPVGLHATTFIAGDYAVYVDDLAGTLLVQTTPTIAAGETGTIFISNVADVKNGRTISIDVTTGSGQSFGFSAIVGQES